MPSIDIREIDNTRPGGVDSANVNIPYIPGMVDSDVYSHLVGTVRYHCVGHEYDCAQRVYDTYYTESGLVPEEDDFKNLNLPEGTKLTIRDKNGNIKSDGVSNPIKVYNIPDETAWEITAIGSSESKTIKENLTAVLTSTGCDVDYDCLEAGVIYITDATYSIDIPTSLVNSNTIDFCSTSLKLYQCNNVIKTYSIAFTLCDFNTSPKFINNGSDKFSLNSLSKNNITLNYADNNRASGYNRQSSEPVGLGVTSDPTVYLIGTHVNVAQEVSATIVDQEISIKPIAYSAPFQANIPVECPTEQRFVKVFGQNPFKFDCDVIYGCSTSTQIGLDNEFGKYACDGAGAFLKAGEFDKSYIVARELSHAGLPVLYEAVTNPVKTNDGVNANNDGKGISYRPITVPEFYTYLKDGGGDSDVAGKEVSAFEKLAEKGDYSVKFITTGGYPVFEYDNNSIVDAMMEVAHSRGDVAALIDHTNNYSRSLIAGGGSGSVYDVVNGLTSDAAGYSLVGKDADKLARCGIYTPWGNYRLASSMPKVRDSGIATVKLPASFAYLICLADAIKYSPDYLAIAGVSRGLVPRLVSLNTSKTLTNTIADSYNPDGKDTEKWPASDKSAIAINAITNIKPYGLTIWGNRTLLDNRVKEGLVAHSCMNTRSMVNNIKKILFTACQSLMFEQNSDVLWVNFLAKSTPTLDQMQGNKGLKRYKILKGKFNEVTGEIEQPDEKAKLYATVKIWPEYAVEAWDITVVLTDEDVEVE